MHYNQQEGPKDSTVKEIGIVNPGFTPTISVYDINSYNLLLHQLMIL